MKTMLLLIGLCTLVCGCRGGGNNELLERDLRLQEDRLYQLQDALDQCQAMLDASRRENEAIKRELVGGDRGAMPESGVPGNIEGPSIEMPGEDAPASRLAPPKRKTSPSRKPKAQPDGVPDVDIDLGSPADAEEVPADPADEDAPRKRTSGRGASSKVTDKRVVKLALNRQLTGGLSHDGHMGDEGIMVVFEPRNAVGQLVKEPGDVSIVVVDPAVTGAGARVARWDFTADEVSQHFKKSALGQGLHFELPWPSNPPKHKKLQLFVRYVGSDGRKINADQPINIDSNDRQAKTWKQSASSSKSSGKSNTATNGATNRVPRDSIKRREPQFLTSQDPGKNANALQGKLDRLHDTWRESTSKESRGESKAVVAASEPGDVIRIPDGPNDPDIRAEAQARALAEAKADGRTPSAERKVEAVTERPMWKPYR